MRLKPSRAIFSLVVILTVSAILGGVFGSRVEATTKGGDERLDSALKMFTRLLSILEENYATEVDSDEVIYGAIDGMLRTLDPHTRFFKPQDFTQLREDQRGKYYGLGITVTSRFGRVMVVSPPFVGSPAEKVGLRVGDVISHVNGKPTQGLELNEVVSRLKGPKGTSVNITLVRPGVDEPLELTVIRDEISKYTINNSFRIRPAIGYIKIDNFAETTGAELREALKQLDYKSLEGLILDLRNNPGGLLQEAIEVSELFLQKGQMIVETRGRTRGSNRPYGSQRLNEEHLYPLVVLINRQSASASEIVAGAIQDHDRGLIVGETSFGKGLVQSVYPLTKNAGLALTTQKWYTPSGRLIQRDYAQVSQFDYYNNRQAPEQKNKEIKHSDLGRVVYGGGGITPDYNVTDTKYDEFQDVVVKRFAFYTFFREFLAQNLIEKSFQVSDAVLGDFKKHLIKRRIAFSEEDFQKNQDFLKRMIRNEVFYNKFGAAEAQRVLLDGDPPVLKAVELIPEAKELSVRARRHMAQRQ